MNRFVSLINLYGIKSVDTFLWLVISRISLDSFLLTRRRCRRRRRETSRIEKVLSVAQWLGGRVKVKLKYQNDSSSFNILINSFPFR